MRSLPLALSLCALLVPAALHADPLSGSFAVDGTLQDTGTTLDFMSANVSSDPFKLMGSFTALLTPGEAVAASQPALNYSPYVADSEVFTIRGLQIDLDTFTKNAAGDFTGTVTLQAAGYDPTQANLTLLSGTAGSTKFEATTITSTPEPSTLVLLGSGVLGAAGAVRRRFVRG